jgi:hypothetical protein
MSMPCAVRRLLFTLLLLALVSAILPEPNRAQAGGFVGRVTHIVTGEPIAGALLSAKEQTALSDEQGWYILLLPPGRHDVRAQAPGYIGMSHTLQPVATGLTVLDFAVIPREPDAEMSRLIEERLEQHGQALSPDLEAHILHDGQVLPSGMTSVPRTVRLLVRENPAIIDSPPVEVIVLDFEEYLKGVVPIEMSPAWHPEALKAQAVAARSYATASMGKHWAESADVCSSVHCQAWRPTHYDTTDTAVEATRGVAATYQGSIIWAFFHGHCDGHTRNSEDVWGGVLPYARSVPCSCGYTTLYGHGVGMCQRGARAMANAGATYDQILKHYYTGIELLVPQRGTLSDARVEPAGGDQGTWFVYRVRYYDSTGAPPPIADVIINGRAETLRRESGDASVGWTYAYTGTLPAGEHSYRFLFDDGRGHVVAAPASGAYGGPTVASSGAPPEETLRRNLTFATAQDWATGALDGLTVVAEATDALALAPGRTQGSYTSAILTPGAPFVAYGLLWQAETPGATTVRIEARASLDGVVWDAWRTLEGEAYLPGADALQSAPLVFGEARYLQFRAHLSAPSAAERPLLRHLRIVCLDTRQGPSSAQWEPPAQGEGGGLVVISRAQWGANESWMTWPPEYRTVRAIVLHHTATGDGGLDPAAVVRAIYYYHAIERGWGDIGYNYLVDAHGRIYEGRAGGPGVVGAHAGIYNWGSVGIGMIGDFQQNPAPQALYSAVTDLTAQQCTLHGIDPLGQTLLIDALVPTILGHRDVAATLCPGQHFYALMGAVRADTLAKMTTPPPTVALAWPAGGQHVRGVIAPEVVSAGIVTRLAYYVDGALRAEGGAGLAWKWNTTLESEGQHTFRVVAENAGGSAEDSVTVLVDNTPPQGLVSAPVWTNALSVPIAITATDALSMALSSGWSWEGEHLPHWSAASDRFQVVSDSAASGGRALRFLAGREDEWGVAYGPYTCDLPPGQGYQVAFSFRTDPYGAAIGLATADLVADQGSIRYAERPIAGDDFASGGYQEFILELDYTQEAPSCSVAGQNAGLEFRTWFSGAGSLWLDRVRVWTAPQPLAGTLWWDAPAAEGLAQVTVRLLDGAGNPADHELDIGIDRTPPVWAQADGSGYWVRDRLAGLDVGQAAWAHSLDDGATWGAWQPLVVDGVIGVHSAALFYADAPAQGLVRYRAVDLAGNESVSPALLAGVPPTTRGPDRLTFLPVALR